MIVAQFTGEAPVDGSYHRADAMGLIRSMAPDASQAFFDVPDPTKPVHTIFDVHARPMDDGCRAFSTSPAIPGPHPGVLVIGGSDGGLGAQGTAMLLASHGYVALSLAYFDGKGLPQTLEGIPMEYFQHALVWLRHQPGIGKIAIYGESRGSEPALWTAAMDGPVDAVIARSPSFALWGGVTASGFVAHQPGTGS